MHESLFIRRNPMYPQDMVKAIRPTHKYGGQITQSSSKPPSSECSTTSVRIIDDAVAFESVDDKTRQAALDFFTSSEQRVSHEKEIHESQMCRGITKAVCGLGIGVSAGYGLLASSLLPLPVAGPVIAGGVALAILGIRQMTHTQHVIDEIQEDLSSLKQEQDQWYDQIDEIIKHRQRAGREGFEYVFTSDLKNTSIHPEEVRALWQRDFTKLLSNHSPIDTVFSDDLLGIERLEYAWEGRPLPELEIAGKKLSPSLLIAMTTRYQECSIAYQNFKQTIMNERAAVNTTRAALLDAISAMRSRWILPALQLYQNGLKEADLLYKNSSEALTREKDLAIDEYKKAFHYVVKNPADSEETAYKSRLDSLCRDAIDAVQGEYSSNFGTITQAHERDRRMCGFLYDQAELVVDHFFDQRVRQLDSEVAQAQNQIEQQLMSGNAHFTKLLEKILHPASERSLIQQSITSPRVLRNWTLSNQGLEPTWNEVYGRLPRFQSTFADDVSEAVWNLFWGNNGMGRYAFSPISSWEQLGLDRSAFSSQQSWFSLHHTPQPTKRMFFRPVVVPPPPSSSTTWTQTKPPPVKEERAIQDKTGTHISIGHGTTKRR